MSIPVTEPTNTPFAMVNELRYPVRSDSLLETREDDKDSERDATTPCRNPKTLSIKNRDHSWFGGK